MTRQLAATEEMEIKRGANALRRYVVARAADREHPEWAREDTAIGAWVGCTEVEAHAHRSFAIRHEKFPWCAWLGNDTTIASDLELQSFFEVHVTNPGSWTILRNEVQRNRVRAFRDWKRLGRRLLAQARDRRERPDLVPPAALADYYAAPGVGMRSIERQRRN